MSMIRTLRNVVAKGLVGLATLLPAGCATIDQPVARTEYSLPVADTKSHNVTIYPSNYPVNENYEKLREARGQKVDLDGFISTGFASDYIGKEGTITNLGPVNDYFFIINKKNNFSTGDVLSAGVLSDYGLNRGRTLETDFFIDYSIPVDFLKNLMGGYSDETYGDRFAVGFKRSDYNFPEACSEDILKLRWFHNSRANLDFELDSLIENPLNGKLSFNFSKKIPFRKIGEVDLSLIPNAGISYENNWFGRSGFPSVIPGVTLLAQRRGVNFSVNLKHQVPLLDGVLDRNFVLAELGIKF